MNPASVPAFLFDPNKCTGCQACEVACTIENGLGDMSWRQVSTFNEERLPGAPVIHLSMACNHCEDAPCMKHCPALAYAKDPDTGLVNLNSDHCIGCGYCTWACPYDAPKFDAPSGVMTKCTFCGHRQAEGLEPACVEGCPTGALGFGPLDALPGGLEMAGIPTTEPGPSIRFKPWEGGEWEGGAGACGAGGCGEPTLAGAQESSKISLRSEWPLLGFTLLGTLLVSIYTASVASVVSFHPLAFILPAIASMGLSSLHLGQKARAWRAILNIRHSWLSREIVLYTAFVGLATLQLLISFFGDTDQVGIGALAVALGFSALFAMDRVYDIVRPASFRYLHSADVVLIGALLLGLLMGWRAPVIFLVLLKLGLYVRRKLRVDVDWPGRKWGWSWEWSLVRLGAGCVLPLLAVGLGLEGGWTWILAATLVGEVMDRVEFYTELVVPTPRRQMAIELPGFAKIA